MADATESIGILQFALDAVVDQQQTIANNISNQDTPNFQADEVTFESSLAQALEGGGTAVLSEREIEVLRLVALGHTNTEIAKQMYISPRTVETHRANLQHKLGVSGRPELVRYALQHGVIHR